MSSPAGAQRGDLPQLGGQGLCKPSEEGAQLRKVGHFLAAEHSTPGCLLLFLGPRLCRSAEVTKAILQLARKGDTEPGPHLCSLAPWAHTTSPLRTSAPALHWPCDDVRPWGKDKEPSCSFCPMEAGAEVQL